MNAKLTAIDLCIDKQWNTNQQVCRIAGGRTFYETARMTRGGNVRLERLTADHHGVRNAWRIVRPDTPIELKFVDEKKRLI